jgi:hypothetical protein
MGLCREPSWLPSQQHLVSIEHRRVLLDNKPQTFPIPRKNLRAILQPTH